MRPLPFLLVVVAALAHAQGKPTLIDAPLDVKVALPQAQLDALADDFRLQLARGGGVLLSTRSNWKAAVAALKRQDCDVRDECLRQLATTGGTLYALYASVERNAAGTEVTATGRVVNQDGVQARAPVVLKVPRKGSFEDTAKSALSQLIGKLELGALPAVLTKPVEPTKRSEPSPVVLAEAPPPPPPLVVTAPPSPSAPPTSGLKVAGFITGGLAVGAAGFALGFGITALSARSTLPADGRFVSDDQVRTQRTVNDAATLALATGLPAGVLAAVAVTCFALAPTPHTTVGLAPVPGGAAMVMGGSF